MAKRSNKPLEEQCLKVTVRYEPEEAKLIADECKRIGTVPAKYLRKASLFYTKNKFLDIFAIVNQIADEQVRFRRDFNEAVETEGE